MHLFSEISCPNCNEIAGVAPTGLRVGAPKRDYDRAELSLWCAPCGTSFIFAISSKPHGAMFGYCAESELGTASQ